MGESSAEYGDAAPETSIPVAKIKANPNQPRKTFDEDQLSELSESIKANGVLQPILVRKKGEGYEIVAGERRYQAAKLAGLKEIPAVVRDIAEEDVFQLALIENLQRSDLDPIEEAQGYRQLIDEKSLTQEQLAKLLSKSRPAIANTLRLLDLPKDVQGLMASGKLTAGHARAILAVPTEEGRLQLAEKVAAEGLSVRQTESIAPLYSGKEEEKRVRLPTPKTFKRAARRLRLSLDTNVRVKQVRGKNKIEIEFKDEEDLARIMGHITGSTEVEE